MYGSSGTEVVPRGPVTEREAGVFVKEMDGWNMIGDFPMLDVCLCVIAEEEKERKVRGIMIWRDRNPRWSRQV